MADTNKLLAALLAALTGEAKPTTGNKGQASGQRRNPKFKAKAKPDTVALCIAAFEAKGYKDVQPKVNVMTYKAWVTKGRKVIPGQKGIKVGPFTLFHIDQTNGLSEVDAQIALKEQNKAIRDKETKGQPVAVLSEDEIVAQAKLILAARMAEKAKAAELTAEYGL